MPKNRLVTVAQRNPPRCRRLRCDGDLQPDRPARRRHRGRTRGFWPGDLHQRPDRHRDVFRPRWAQGSACKVCPPEGQAKQSVAKADPERGQIGLRQQALPPVECRPSRRLITRTIGEEDPFRGRDSTCSDAACQPAHSSHLTTWAARRSKDAPLECRNRSPRPGKGSLGRGLLALNQSRLAKLSFHSLWAPLVLPCAARLEALHRRLLAHLLQQAVGTSLQSC